MDGFTPDALTVVNTARHLAESRGEPKIAPHLLLVALARAGSPRVQAALQALGVSAAAADRWLEERVGPLRIRLPFDDAAAYSLQMAAILDVAGIEAAAVGAPAVRSEDLLVGLMGEAHSARGIAGAFLVEQGATYERIKAAVA